MFLRKAVLKICSKFTGEHPCRSVISIRHACSPVNLMHIFRTRFLKDTHREKAPSKKSMNMDIWAVGTLNQLFIKDS